MLLLKASVLLSLTLIGTRVMRRSPATARHQLWSLAFAALLLLPVLTIVLPALEIPLPERWSTTAVTAAPDSGHATLTLVTPSSRGARGDEIAAAPSTKGGRPSGGAVTLPPLAVLLRVVWIVGALAAAGALLVSYIRVWRMSRQSHPLNDAAWTLAQHAVADRLGLRHLPRVVVSESVRTPMAGGTWQPVVFLPSVARDWSEERRQIVLAHEMAHLASRDPLRLLAARLALACYWFHPLAWLAARQSSIAREQACDEAVLALGIRPSVYAGTLLELAETMIAPPRVAAALPMIHPSLLEKRLMAILDTERPARARRPLALAACAALVTLPIAASRPAARALMGPPSAAMGQPATPPPAPPAPSGVSLVHFTGGVVITSAPPVGQTANDGCWADDFHGSFRGSSTTIADAGGRAVVSDMIGTRNGDRVVQTHFGDLRVCMVALGAAGLERSKPSEWAAPRLLIETRRGSATAQMEIRGGRQTTWRVNGAERAVDAAAQEWRAAMLAVLDATWELSTLRGDVSTLRGEISTVRGEESTLRGQISTLMGEVSTMRGNQSTIRGEESSLRGEISTIRGHVSSLRGQISSEQGAISSIQANRWEATAGERDRIDARVRDHEKEIARLEGELRDYDEAAKIAAVERRIQELDADRKTAAIAEEINRFVLNAKTAAIERQIRDLDVDGKVAAIERRIDALDAERRGRALEDRRDEAVKRLEQAVGAIR